MKASEKDPTEPIRLKASRYAEVDEGTACTQSSFKTHKRAFLYIGKQGGGEEDPRYHQARRVEC